MIRLGRGLVAALSACVRESLGAALALALVPSLVRAASKTWSVNVGGSGDTADLQEAVDRAQPGDTILLWGPANGRQLLPGVTITKGLTIVGLAQDRVHLQAIHVHDVPAGQSVTIVNVVVGDYDLFPYTDDSRTLYEAARVEDCAGPVVFSGCFLWGGFLWFDMPPDAGGPGLRAVRSDVILIDCEVVGGRGGDAGESISGQVNMQHALVLEDARALVAGSVLRGGDGIVTKKIYFRQVGGRGGDGVRALGASSLWLLDSTVLGGAGQDIETFPGSLGRGGDGGNGVRVDPLARAYARATTIEGGAGGWEPTHPGRDGRDVMGELEVEVGPGLALDLAPWTRDDDPIDAQLHGIPNANAYLLVGKSAGFRGTGGSGVLAVDAPVTISLGSVPPTGELSATVPSLALAHGEARLLVVQSAFDEPTGRVLGEPRPILVLDARWLPDRQRFHVDASASPGGDGRSWATAFRDLREALEAAPGIGSGLTDIWVREGVYRPIPAGPAPLEPFYVKSQTRVYGGFDGTETDLAQRHPALHPTVLSGDLLGNDDASDASRADNSRLVLAIGPWDHRESVRLDGLVFAGGFGGRVSNGSTFPFTGSGVMLLGSVDIAGCTFTDIRRGCALDVVQGSDVRVVGCRFLGNHATVDSGSYGMGACRIGGDGNSSAKAVFADCEFTGNSAVRGAGIVTSGATWVWNCTFYGNSAEQEGGAIEAYYHCPRLIVGNSLLWGNHAASDPDISVVGQTYFRVDSSLFQGGSTSSWGTGNIEGPPRLFDPEGPDGILGTIDDDLTPRTSSPAVDAGNNALLPLDVLDIDLDGDVDEPLPLDAAGLPRKTDDPNVPDTGSGTAPIVDIGSRERQP